MHLTTRNVNTAFTTIIKGIENKSIPTIKTQSRNGPVLQIDEPFIFTYTHPRERVLFNKERDANPFFHVYEALWMLSGRNDVAALKYYASKIDQFSDNGTTFNGAYGFRWRHAWTGSETVQAEGEVDQLSIIINHLKEKPESRRVVLQMWNVVDDLLKIGLSETTTEDNKVFKTFSPASKDVCCNLSVMFSIRTEDMTQRSHAEESMLDDTVYVDAPHKYLDITVTNRSNDIIWGMLGANFVHFSFLQEYVACALGIEMGHYHHFSNNAHVYTETNSGWHPEKWLAETKIRTMHDKPPLSYGKGPNDASGNVGTSPLLFAGDESVELFDKECREFVELNKNGEFVTGNTQWSIQFLTRTAQPMMQAFHMYKQRDFNAAFHWCNQIAGADWRVACTNWIQKRKENFEKKGQSDVSSEKKVGNFRVCPKCDSYTNALPGFWRKGMKKGQTNE